MYDPDSQQRQSPLVQLPQVKRQLTGTGPAVESSTELEASSLPSSRSLVKSGDEPKKILLVNSPNEVETALANANYSMFPHIGIVQLATRLKEDFGDSVAVQVIDGGITPIGHIHERIGSFRPDLLGISVLTPTYGEGLKLAETGKEVNSQVVLGNDHAMFFPEEILRNQPTVDYVIVNDVGEQPLAELVEAISGMRQLSEVDSLAYRQDGVPVINPKKSYKLSERNTVPDLGLIEGDLPVYADKYFEEHGHLHGKKVKVVTVNNARGCENALRCSYCSIADLRINTGNPHSFWDTVLKYNDRYGINLFFEVFDSFTASPKYIASLLETMPAEARKKINSGEIEFMIYARALGLLARDNVNRFYEMGVRRVNIGLDSGDSKILEAQRKNKTTNETNLNALKSLGEAGISVHGSFMLGAAGETVETVGKTIEHIHQIMEFVRFSSIEVSRLFPLPNSPIWDMLVDYHDPKFYKGGSDEIDQVLGVLGITVSKATHRELSDKYLGRDLFLREELMDDWYKHFTHIDQSYALQEIAKVDDLIRSRKIGTGNNIG